MKLHILVEGPADEAFLNAWLPRFLPDGHTFVIIPHQGKGRLPADPKKRPDPKRRGLLDQLPAKLRAYGKSLKPDTDRVVVLVDLDDQDCQALKKSLTRLLEHCRPKPETLFRIAIEETEAFFLGDKAALRKAFPGARTAKLNAYRQDSICGTWELLREIIRAPPDSENKVAWAEAIGPVLGVHWRGARANRSPSFRQFCRGILRLCGEPARRGLSK